MTPLKSPALLATCMPFLYLKCVFLRVHFPLPLLGILRAACDANLQLLQQRRVLTCLVLLSSIVLNYRDNEKALFRNICKASSQSAGTKHSRREKFPHFSNGVRMTFPTKSVQNPRLIACLGPAANEAKVTSNQRRRFTEVARNRVRPAISHTCSFEGFASNSECGHVVQRRSRSRACLPARTYHVASK